MNTNSGGGDEDGSNTWAGGGIGKAKDMWNAFGYDVKVSGSDLGWSSLNKGGTTMAMLKSHDVVLFINSPLFLRDEWKNNWFGTHYIRVNQMSSANGNYNVGYWDYGAWKTGNNSRVIGHNQFWWATYGLIAIPK